MGLQEWLKDFRALHERARKGELSEREQNLYRDGREELATALLQAQRLTRKPDETARDALRVARALQVDLQLHDKQRIITLDLSVGGFSAVAGKPLETGAVAEVTMKMPDGVPLEGRAKVVSTMRQGGGYRVSFAFEGLGQTDIDRLGFVVFDTALMRLGS